MSDTKIKICGMTRPEDIRLVNSLGVDMAGFVLFFPKSRRNLSLEEADILASHLDLEAVAVMVSPMPAQIKSLPRSFGCVQIHGELYEETYNSLRRDMTVIRAFNSYDMAEIARCSQLDRIEYFLFDAAEPGSGKRCDWNGLAQLPKTDKKLILAGGLTPDNVVQAIETVHPYMVDVSSGVELPQGGKDPVLAKRFVEAVRGL